jgi:hypothetical protein
LTAGGMQSDRCLFTIVVAEQIAPSSSSCWFRQRPPGRRSCQRSGPK